METTKIERDTKREKWIFAWEVAQEERQKGLDFADNFFVKRTNQGEYVRLWQMAQS